MNFYRTTLSALLLIPIIGGIGVKMIHGYQNATEAAERYITESEKQMEQTADLLEEALDETLDLDMNTEILSDDTFEDDISTEGTEELQQLLNSDFSYVPTKIIE